MKNQLRARKYQISRLGIVLVFVCFSLFKPIMAQLVVQSNQTAQALVDELSGPGVLISNVQYTGASVASGLFSHGSSTNLGLSTGVILTSGCASNAIGPNSQTSISCDNNEPGDVDLTSIIGDQTNDASVLEFDFIPALDTIQVRYVFGSDEYTEFIGSYNDVFAFFITGPKPSGGTYANYNIAIIPGTLNTPVSIDNVNSGNPAGSGCEHCEYYVNNNVGETTIEYDGFTTVLTAWAVVVPCETYHMKFAIADAVDWQLDTGVFLEGGSFTSVGTEIMPVATTPNGDDFAVEGCLDIEITITPMTIQTTPLVVDFESIGGTAINGVDYTYLPLSHTIPANTASITITLEAFNDGLLEGEETIIIEYKEVSCVTNTYTIRIKDGLPQVTATFPNGGTAICDNTTGELSASVGFAEYFWDTGEDTRTITVTPGNYSVVATDQYGCESSANVTVNATASPPANSIMHH